MKEFQEILKSDPNNEAACRGMGYAYLERQDFDQAGEYFKRAAQVDSKDARVHYYNALMMVRKSGFGGGADSQPMTKELETQTPTRRWRMPNLRQEIPRKHYSPCRRRWRSARAMKVIYTILRIFTWQTGSRVKRLPCLSLCRSPTIQRSPHKWWACWRRRSSSRPQRRREPCKDIRSYPHRAMSPRPLVTPPPAWFRFPPDRQSSSKAR
jgi:hypothetical protein